MLINGFEYTEDEILDALREKGYLILPWVWETIDETFPGGKELMKINTKCALKGADLCSEKTMWQNVALKEFQKKFVKPKLI